MFCFKVCISSCLFISATSLLNFLLQQELIIYSKIAVGVVRVKLGDRGRKDPGPFVSH